MMQHFRHKRQDKHQMDIPLLHGNLRIVVRNFLFEFLLRKTGIRIAHYSYSQY